MQKVLFIGGFGSGKNTLINALLRKEVLSTSPMFCPEDNYITQIVSSKQEECWYVNYKNGDKEQLDFPKLHSMYSDPEACDNSFLESIKSLIFETPAQTDDLCFIVANQYDDCVESIRSLCCTSSAIVYLANSTMPFTDEDKRFIDVFLSNCNSGNVFFCFNKISLIDVESIQLLKDVVKKNLASSFTSDGVFDKKLYCNRVFFIDAYPSMCTRLGKLTRTPYGEISIADIHTDVPEFEYTLRKFLQQRSFEKQRAMEQRK